MDAGGPKGKAKSDINVTPLIDIVLVLLIVFIVMVPGLSKAQTVTVPQVVVAPPQTNVIPPLVISIDKAGNYMLQSDKIQLDDMAEKIQAAAGLQVRNSRKVYLKVDEEMPFGRAVDAMDQIRLAGDRLKVESVKKFADGTDGGDIKVSISIKRRA